MGRMNIDKVLLHEAYGLLWSVKTAAAYNLRKKIEARLGEQDPKPAPILTNEMIDHIAVTCQNARQFARAIEAHVLNQSQPEDLDT